MADEATATTEDRRKCGRSSFPIDLQAVSQRTPFWSGSLKDAILHRMTKTSTDAVSVTKRAELQVVLDTIKLELATQQFEIALAATLPPGLRDKSGKHIEKLRDDASRSIRRTLRGVSVSALRSAPDLAIELIGVQLQNSGPAMKTLFNNSLNKASRGPGFRLKKNDWRELRVKVRLPEREQAEEEPTNGTFSKIGTRVAFAKPLTNENADVLSIVTLRVHPYGKKLLTFENTLGTSKEGLDYGLLSKLPTSAGEIAQAAIDRKAKAAAASFPEAPAGWEEEKDKLVRVDIFIDLAVRVGEDKNVIFDIYKSLGCGEVALGQQNMRAFVLRTPVHAWWHVERSQIKVSLIDASDLHFKSFAEINSCGCAPQPDTYGFTSFVVRNRLRAVTPAKPLLIDLSGNGAKVRWGKAVVEEDAARAAEDAARR